MNTHTGCQLTLMDTCSYGRMGLAAVFSGALSISSVTVTGSLQEAFSTMLCSAKHDEAMRHLVIRLPTTAQAALVLLLQLSDIIEAGAFTYQQVMVLSPFDVSVVQRMITTLGMDGIHVVDDRLSVLNLYRAILPVNGCKDEAKLHRSVLSRLTPGERKVLYYSLMNWPIHRQARSWRVSPKTIYTQRAGALRKLGVADILSLLRYLNP
ncbi:helix-turn-helix transcriptional regulator [Serratia fonticola]|uniref:helix-turn-helix transcriptional regulator n=1 Tax=Serratia fonticola TaxID=47917 RepID=UPI003AF3E498